LHTARAFINLEPPLLTPPRAPKQVVASPGQAAPKIAPKAGAAAPTASPGLATAAEAVLKSHHLRSASKASRAAAEQAERDQQDAALAAVAAEAAAAREKEGEAFAERMRELRERRMQEIEEEEEGCEEDGEGEEEDEEEGESGIEAGERAEAEEGIDEGAFVIKGRRKRKHKPLLEWGAMEEDEYVERSETLIRKEDSDATKQGSQRWSSRNLEVLLKILQGMEATGYPRVQSDWEVVAERYNAQMRADAKAYAKDKTKPAPGRERTAQSIYQKWSGKPPSGPEVVTGNPRQNHPLDYRKFQVWKQWVALKGSMNDSAGGAGGGYKASAAGAAALLAVAQSKEVRAKGASGRKAVAAGSSTPAGAAATAHGGAGDTSVGDGGAAAGAPGATGRAAGSSSSAGAAAATSSASSSSSSSAAAAFAARAAVTSTYPLPAGAPRTGPFALSPYLSQELDPGRRRGSPQVQRNLPSSKQRQDSVYALLAGALAAPSGAVRREVDVEKEYTERCANCRQQYIGAVADLKQDREDGAVDNEFFEQHMNSLRMKRNADMARFEADKNREIDQLRTASAAKPTAAAPKRKREADAQAQGAAQETDDA
jgi:hypothetical protein